MEALTLEKKKDVPNVSTAGAVNAGSIPERDTDGNYDFLEVANFLATLNRSDYNVLKCCEELTELQEKLLKFHLKTPEKRPSVKDITEEIGDVLFRTLVLAIQFDIQDDVDDRITYKVGKFMEYFLNGKYKGGI